MSIRKRTRILFLTVHHVYNVHCTVYCTVRGSKIYDKQNILGSVFYTFTRIKISIKFKSESTTTRTRIGFPFPPTHVQLFKILFLEVLTHPSILFLDCSFEVSERTHKCYRRCMPMQLLVIDGSAWSMTNDYAEYVCENETFRSIVFACFHQAQVETFDQKKN